MTKDEALRMAIEALIYHTEQTRPIEDTDIAIQACKDALAETQEPILIQWYDEEEDVWENTDERHYQHYADTGHKIRFLYTTPPKAETQEPMIIKQENGMVLKLGYDELPNGTAFYTTPPSREWQRLQNDEIYKILNDNIGSSSYAIAHAISEALREKNNG